MFMKISSPIFTRHCPYFETIMPNGVIEIHGIFAEATNCNVKAVDWLCNFLTNTCTKKLLLYSAPRLTFRK